MFIPLLMLLMLAKVLSLYLMLLPSLRSVIILKQFISVAMAIKFVVAGIINRKEIFMKGKPLTHKGSQWLFRMTASKSKPQNRWRPQRGGIRL